MDMEHQNWYRVHLKISIYVGIAPIPTFAEAAVMAPSVSTPDSTDA